MAPLQIRLPHAPGECCDPAGGVQTRRHGERQDNRDPEAQTTALTKRSATTHPDASRPWGATLALNKPWFYTALVIAGAAWILHGFVEAMLAASVIAIASWPLYMRFVNCFGPRLSRGTASLIFTSVITLFVLAPMIFALVALFTEAQSLLSDIAAAAQSGVGAPEWLSSLPLVGGWLAGRWASLFGALAGPAEQFDPTVLLAWIQRVGQFTAHHALIIIFTVLLLYFLYRRGEQIADALRRALRESSVDAERYFQVATRAVQGSLNSMVVVGLSDGLAATMAFALLGVPHAVLWGAIIGALALIPFLGYVGVGVLAWQLAMKGAAGLAFVTFVAGTAILVGGDKIVRPLLARDKVALPFVWFLMGCLGGFEVLGVAGLVVGPVVLTVARELSEQYTHLGQSRKDPGD